MTKNKLKKSFLSKVQLFYYRWCSYTYSYYSLFNSFYNKSFLKNYKRKCPSISFIPGKTISSDINYNYWLAISLFRTKNNDLVNNILKKYYSRTIFMVK